MPRLEVAASVELHYRLAGVASEEAVVFINGLTMDSSAWREVEAEFVDGFATVRYDCRGQGESDKPAGPYSPRQHASDLIVLLDALELERVHLVGLSNGGLISLIAAGELATSAPDRILSVTTIDSFARVDTMLRTVLKSWRAALDSGGAALRFDVATPWVWGHSFLSEHATELAGFREVAAQADREAIGYLIDGLADSADERESLRAYRGPLLAVVGEEDLLTPLRYSHEILEWARHGTLVTVGKAGHAAPVERPEAVAPLVRNFIRERQALPAQAERERDE
ncbi:MAG: alpha/beta fold hydrolase [Trueperaceae bacterium]